MTKRSLTGERRDNAPPQPMSFRLSSSWFRKQDSGNGRAEFETGLDLLGVRGADVLVHTSYKSLASTVSDPEAVVDALLGVASTVLMPAFTYHTFDWQAEGDVAGNAYPSKPDGDPAVFTADTPISRSIGLIPELMRHREDVYRSRHPWLSFIAHGPAAGTLISAEDEGPAPLGPIHRLYESGGMILLLGVGHTSSTALHLAERYEKRPSFSRHARTPDGTVEVWDNGCSDAFGDVADAVRGCETSVTIGRCRARAYPIREYIDAARALIQSKPTALLCTTCERCITQRARLSAQGTSD